MNDNTTARVLRYVGIIIIVFGILFGIFLGVILENVAVPLGVGAAAVVFGILILGLGEIISLLAKSVEKQQELLQQLSSKADEPSAPSQKH